MFSWDILFSKVIWNLIFIFSKKMRIWKPLLGFPLLNLIFKKNKLNLQEIFTKILLQNRIFVRKHEK